MPRKPRRPISPTKAALAALDLAIYDLTLAMRWRMVRENAPPGSRVFLHATDECRKASQRAYDRFMRVRKALGYNPEDDEPPPKRHWDAGA
jgi:hypothetical protein